MQKQFKKALVQLQVKPDHRLLIAVSGGVDSMVLLHLAAASGLRIAVAHANFKLRGKNSDEDQAMVERFCAEKEISCFTTALPISKADAKDGVQAEARKLRYAWFEELLFRERFDFLLTAHHRGDLVETFFLHLLRGAGVKGLRSIPQKNGKVLRPLLDFTRSEILTYAKTHEVPWREDASNAEETYARNKVRHRLVPAFEQLSPKATDNLAKSVNYISEADEFLAVQSQLFIDTHLQSSESGFLTLSYHDAKQLWNFPALGKYVFDLLGFDPNQLVAAAALGDGQPGKHIAGSRYRMMADRQRFVFAPTQAFAPGEATLDGDQGEISEPLKLNWGPYKIDEAGFPSGNTSAVLDATKLEFPLALRQWRPGDRFVPLGMNGSKKLSDFLVDIKCSIAEKEQVLVLISGDEICWVVGYRIDERFKVASRESPAIRFTLG